MKKRLISALLLALMLTNSIAFIPTALASGEGGLGSVEVFVTAKDKYNYEQLDNLEFERVSPNQNTNYVKVYPEKTKQELLGVGGAITESAAYNISKLPKADQEMIYEAYFGESGSKYSLIRSSIGSADFSIKSYSYNDTEEPDPELNNFSIETDWDFILPAIKRIQAYNPDVKFYAAPWAPPAWMKRSGIRRGCTGTAALNLVDNSFNPAYYESYANYFVKYIQAYEEAGVDVYSISIQNEAQNNPKWEACTWTPEATAEFIGRHLGPALERNGLDVELLIWDWDKGNDPMHGDGFIKFNTKVLSDERARKYIDGIAFHWYAGDVWHEIAGVPMWSKDFYSLDIIKERFPEINLHATEACQEKGPWFGSFDPADRYIYDILNDFDHGVKSWIDWNLVLDREGGPTQGVVNKCHAPIMLDENDNVHLQSAYYVLKQISRSVQPGTVAVETATDIDVAKVALVDGEGHTSVMLGNVSNYTKTVNVIDGQRTVSVTLEPHSITTLKYDTEYVFEPSVDAVPMVVKPIAATASSYERNPFKNYRAISAIDESTRTRWASDWQDREFITFELLAESKVSGIWLEFENGHDSVFEIQVSNDGVNFETVKQVQKSEFVEKDVLITFDSVDARYVRFMGVQRNNRYGYSIYDAGILVQPK